MTDETPAYSNHNRFFFQTPLYERLTVTTGLIRSLLWGGIKIDGYCPHCRRASTFDRATPGTQRTGYGDAHFLQLVEFFDITFRCARSDGHLVHFNCYLTKAVVEKVGQFPSFADIAIDESKDYSKLLDKENTAEFHKAIGLAAHGVGIGSFVYLRRIFERLISKRFLEYRDVEGWSDDEFYRMRMSEKIDYLKNHLPEFLVKNAKIYSILSLGLHELTEIQCLAFFPVLRQSTVWILEQDKKKQEELAQQEALQRAISQFATPPKS